MNLADRIEESLRIEGIHRRPTALEVAEHERILNLDRLTIDALQSHVSVYQPGNILRTQPGMDVRIGSYIAPAGGYKIPQFLQELLNEVNAGTITPWQAHVDYEMLHPFTDGNGRSGRMLWYWMMRDRRLANLGFLHGFYYQTLGANNP